MSDYENLLKTVNVEKNKIIVGIDHNLDLLKYKTHTPTKKFVEMLYEFDQVPSITRPTRITKSSATLIDNIFIPTVMLPVVNSYLLIDDMSDHLPAITVLKNVELCAKTRRLIETRDTQPKNIECLKKELSEVNWATYLSIDRVIPQNVVVNAMFDNFHSKIQNLLDKHVPI